MIRSAIVLAFCLAALVHVEPARADPCTEFQWDVSAVLAAYAEPAESVRAASTDSQPIPAVALERAHTLELSAESSVSLPATPGRPTRDDAAQAGFVRFSVPVPGRYLVAATSRHWIDVIDDTLVLESTDFRGVPDCGRPHKIVEFDLPGERPLILQLSGSAETPVTVVIAPASARAPEPAPPRR